MKKIPTIFQRDPDNRTMVLDEINPECQWVFDGEGDATQKYDGTCCCIKNGITWKRRELKRGKKWPKGFELADHDTVTGKTVGWVKIIGAADERWHLEGLNTTGEELEDGTYELCGPKVQGNPEGFAIHVLLPHVHAVRCPCPDRTFYGIRKELASVDVEGYVFRHPDGRMAKIKKREFGLKRSI